MKLELTRTEVCDIMLATTTIVHGAREEMNDMDTTETRRGILKGTIRKWQTLHDEIKTQLDEHDANLAEPIRETEEKYTANKSKNPCNQWTT